MKHAKIDPSQLKAAVDAIKDRKRPDIHQLRLAQRSKLTKLRRKLGRNMPPLLTGSFDAKKIDKVLAHHHAETHDLLEKEKAETAKRLAAIAKSGRLGIENTMQALEQIQFEPYVFNLIPLTTPYLIYATPVGMLHDTHTEPWNNWAKFSFSSDQDTAYSSVVVSFYFAWQNRSDYLAVINCNAALLINGLIEVTAEQGWLFPGGTSLDLWASLTVFLGQNPVNYQGTQKSQMGVLYIEGGGPFSAGSIAAENIFGTYPLSCRDIQVQASQTVVFEVACTADWWIDAGGSIVLDFDSAPSAYQVACPSLNVELLTAPQGPIEWITLG